jgi:CRISPR-associated protein Cas2
MKFPLSVPDFPSNFRLPWKKPSQLDAKPYLFAYDITEPRRSRKVLKTLKRWRVDGQLSVHETYLHPRQAENLAVELREQVDGATDRLLFCRLSEQGGGHPIHGLQLAHTAPALGAGRPVLPPRQLHAGWYLVAYDIREPDRLRRVHRAIARGALHLQRSVYLYQGSGPGILKILDAIREEIDPKVDDVRLYSLAHPRDIWFLCGDPPPLPAFLGQDGRLS